MRRRLARLFAARSFRLGAAVALAGALAWWFLREDDGLKVPLGVEQAAIITYGGPALVVKPFRYGVAVNVRIAQVVEQGGAKVYDVRYLVNREGEHDLVGYLASADGSALTGLPAFKVRGDPKLSKELEARVKETEDVGIEVGGHYRATLAGLGVFWIAWLLLLIFWRRPRKVPPPCTVIGETTDPSSCSVAPAAIVVGPV